MTPEDKIMKAIELGNVFVESDKAEALSRMAFDGEPDFTITHTEIEATGKNWFSIGWQTKSAGFGSVTFYKKEDGSTFCDNEAMGPQFIKSVFDHFIDGAKLSDR